MTSSGMTGFRSSSEEIRRGHVDLAIALPVAFDSVLQVTVKVGVVADSTCRTVVQSLRLRLRTWGIIGFQVDRKWGVVWV